jgi:hypothetical protein
MYVLHALLFFIVGSFKMLPFGLLFMNLNPLAWKEAFKTKEGKKAYPGFFFTGQLLRIALGAVIGFFIYHACNVAYLRLSFGIGCYWSVHRGREK